MAARVRRTPEKARTEILDAAVELLCEGGIEAVQVRAVAARVGMTDAGVTHHFRNRRNLLHELLRHGAQRMVATIESAVQQWLHDEVVIAAIIEELANIYRAGFSDLAIALYDAGWREHGVGLLEPLVQALHARRPDDAELTDTRLTVAALHQAIALDPVYGDAFRRSAGITPGDESHSSHAAIQWWASTLECRLQIASDHDNSEDR